MNGTGECGYRSRIAGIRSDFYRKWLAFFDLPDFEDGLGCSDQQSYFPAGGSADLPSFWRKDWSNQGRCYPAIWETGYSIYARDDYKRCVCDEWGAGAEDCATEEKEEPEPTPDPEPTPEPTIDVEAFIKALEEIKTSPDDPIDSEART